MEAVPDDHRTFLREGWPILKLILPRASDEVVAKLAKDVKKGLLDSYTYLRLDYHKGLKRHITHPTHI